MSVKTSAKTLKQVNITGEVLRISPLREIKVKGGNEVKKVVDIIIATEFDYMRVSLWDEKLELVRNNKIKIGDVLRIENAYFSKESFKIGEKRVNAGKYTKIEKKTGKIEALRDLKPLYLTVLAVARPEKGQICIAGIDERGNWIRPQGVYESDVLSDENRHPHFENLSISKIYVDAWKGRNPRKEDRFFISSKGIVKELSEKEKKEFLEKNADASVDSAFKKGKTLGLIKPKILRVYEEKKKRKDEEKSYKQYIRFDFKDSSGRIYRRWSCRCAAFYKTWNELKRRHRWTYRLRMLRHLRKNDSYFTIGLTYTDYGVEKLEYGAYPMIVGVHILILPKSFS